MTAYDVEPGDGVYFDASTPHSYRCVSKSAAHAIIVTMHQVQNPQPAVNLRPLGTAMANKGSMSNGATTRPSANVPPPSRPKDPVQVEN